jgi:hypothetical protein
VTPPKGLGAPNLGNEVAAGRRDAARPEEVQMRKVFAMAMAVTLPLAFVACDDDDDDVDTPDGTDVDLDPGAGTGLPGDESDETTATTAAG